MQFSVARTVTGPRVAVRVSSDEAVITPWSSITEAIAAGMSADGVDGFERVPVSSLVLGPSVGRPGKIFCVGHNYRAHILEMGHALPEWPNVFAKFAESLVGPRDDIVLDPVSQAWDWEAELALVVGAPTRNIDPRNAREHIAGYTVANDISARDWQKRATQWIVGKTFEDTNPIGPWIVTPDELDPADGLRVSCSVDGVEKQSSMTSDLVFDPSFLLGYLSQVITLHPGDVILTGTPGGVGAARQPAEFLRPGQTVVTEIEGIGVLSNRCVTPAGVDA